MNPDPKCVACADLIKRVRVLSNKLASANGAIQKSLTFIEKVEETTLRCNPTLPDSDSATCTAYAIGFAKGIRFAVENIKHEQEKR